MLDEQSRHIAYILSHALERRRRARSRPTQEAEEAWVQTIIDARPVQPRLPRACTPGYYNNEGKPSERGVRNGFYGAGSVAFFKVLADWRARPRASLPGLELTYVA